MKELPMFGIGGESTGQLGYFQGANVTAGAMKSPAPALPARRIPRCGGLPLVKRMI
jgi:hypothetical protein